MDLVNSWDTAIKIRQKPLTGRMRLAARFLKRGLKSMKAGYFDFVGNVIRAETRLAWLTVRDLTLPTKKVECNLCGWTGYDFYPNVGCGYNEKSTLCPGCDCLDRYRSLAVILWTRTEFFSPDTYVIEVAPVRNFQKYCLLQKKNGNYISFDIERPAMEKGDLTRMRYQDSIADYFLCFHVLEHIQDEAKALSEIRRVLKPGGLAILQVPIDWDVAKTYEYSAANPRDVGHVRRYGRDFAQRLSAQGFEVTTVSVTDCTTEDQICRFGLSKEPVFLAKRVA